MGLWRHTPRETYRQKVHGHVPCYGCAMYFYLRVANQTIPIQNTEYLVRLTCAFRKQTSGVVGYDNHVALRTTTNSQLRRMHATELVVTGRSKLPCQQFVPQFDSRGWRASIDSLLSAEDAYQAAARFSGRGRVPHRGHHPRHGSPRQNQVGLGLFFLCILLHLGV